jgi:hypothetical protein
MSWAALGLLLVFLPVGLQRRFMMGLYIPLAGLAVTGLEPFLSRRKEKSPPLVKGGWRIQFRTPNKAWMVVFFLALPTNMLILSAAAHGIKTHDPAIYLTSGESRALRWVEENTRGDAVILAAPQTGLYIPAWTGRRVIYGHPYETVNAVQEEALTEAFFQDPRLLDSNPALGAVEYVFDGPRERDLGGEMQEKDLEIAYRADGVIVYRVKR